MGCTPAVRNPASRFDDACPKVLVTAPTFSTPKTPPPTDPPAEPPVWTSSDEVFTFNRFSALRAEYSLDIEIIAANPHETKKRNSVELTPRKPGQISQIRDFDVHTLLGHSRSVKFCVVSPDETKVASACMRETIITVWDLHSGKPLLFLDGHVDGVLCCDFSQDNRLVSGSIDSTLVVWDSSTGKMFHRLLGHQYLVCTCGFSEDGSLIVSGSGDSCLIIWSARSGLPLGTLEGHTKIVSSCSFSPDGNYILSASADRTLIIWDTRTGDRFRQLRAHVDVILSCSYNFDGSKIVSNDKRTLRLWDSMSGNELWSLSIASSSLSSESPGDRRFNLCVFSPDGHNVISCSNDHSVTVWDPDTGQEVLCFPCRRAAVALSSGPNNLIVYGDESGNIYVGHLKTFFVT